MFGITQPSVQSIRIYNEMFGAEGYALAQEGLRMRFANGLKTAVLLAFMMGLCMLVGRFLGGQQGLIIGFLFGGIGNLIAYFFSDKIAIASMQGREVGPDELPWLHAMVEQLASRAGIPKPRIYVCPQQAPNAFATGRNPRHAAVAVTQGMLSFPHSEIEAVLGHELGHVLHRDVLISTIAATMAGAITFLAHMFWWTGGGYGNDRRDSGPLAAIGMLLSIVLAPLAAALIQMAISRSREYSADEFGGRISGDPLQLASALARLENVNEQVPTQGNPAFHSLFIMH